MLQRYYKTLLLVAWLELVLFIAVTSANPALNPGTPRATLSSKQYTAATINAFKLKHHGNRLSTEGYSALFYPSNVLHLQKSSIFRALKHADDHWNHSDLTIPLAASDHRQLYRGVVRWMVGLTILMEIISAFFLRDIVKLPQDFLLCAFIYIVTLTIAWLQISIRVEDHKDDLRIVRLVERKLAFYNDHPRELSADPHIIDSVKKFEALTGWTVAWTDNPDVLVWPQAIRPKEVVCNIGWLLESFDRDEAWRWPYFNNQILRTIRNHKKMENTSAHIIPVHLTSA
jgi:hypothetical protein